MIWGYILGGATIFAVIVGIFSLYNGRATRREITRVIEEEGKRNREMLGKLSDQHNTMTEILRLMQSLVRKE